MATKRTVAPVPAKGGKVVRKKPPKPKPMEPAAILERMLETSTGESVALEIIDEIISRGAKLLWEHEMQEKVMAQTAKLTLSTLIDTVEHHLAPHDIGEPWLATDAHQPPSSSYRVAVQNWTPDPEPEPIPIDRWARGVLPARRSQRVSSRSIATNPLLLPGQPSGLAPSASQTSLQSNTTETDMSEAGSVDSSRSSQFKRGSIKRPKRQSGGALGSDRSKAGEAAAAAAAAAAVLSSGGSGAVSSTAAAAAAAAAPPTEPFVIKVAASEADEERERLREGELRAMEKRKKAVQRAAKAQKRAQEERERLEKLQEELKGKEYTFDERGNVILVQPMRPEQLPSLTFAPRVDFRDGAGAHGSAGAAGAAAGKTAGKGPKGRVTKPASTITSTSSEGAGGGAGKKSKATAAAAAAAADAKKLPIFVDLGVTQPPLINAIKLEPGVTIKQAGNARSVPKNPGGNPLAMTKKEFTAMLDSRLPPGEAPAAKPIGSSAAAAGGPAAPAPAAAPAAAAKPDARPSSSSGSRATSLPASSSLRSLDQSSTHSSSRTVLQPITSTGGAKASSSLSVAVASPAMAAAAASELPASPTRIGPLPPKATAQDTIAALGQNRRKPRERLPLHPGPESPIRKTKAPVMMMTAALDNPLVSAGAQVIAAASVVGAAVAGAAAGAAGGGAAAGGPSSARFDGSRSFRATGDYPHGFVKLPQPSVVHATDRARSLFGRPASSSSTAGARPVSGSGSGRR